MKLCVETVGLHATVTRSKAEAGSMTHQLPLPHNDLWQEIMWACCLNYRILFSVQANGAMKLAAWKMAKQAPARSHAQVFKHASCSALSCTLWMSLQCGV